MKTIDVTKPVMQKVMRFERRRTYTWIGNFIVILCGLLVTASIFFWIAGAQLIEQKTLEMLDLFTQDCEIIAEFWQDTLGTVWEELPQAALLVGGLALAGIIILIILTRRRWPIIRKRLSELGKYKDIE